MTDLFEQRLRKAAQAMPVPVAPASLIDRVIDERANGMRISLPDDAPAPRRSRLPALTLLLAAASVVAAMTVVARRGGRLPGGLVDADSVSSFEQLFVSAGVLPRSAFAQGSPTGPGAPPLATINGLALRPGAHSYRIQWIDASGHPTPDGDGTLRISNAAVEGAPAWRVEHVARLTGDSGQRRVEAETLYVTQRELRPLTRVVHVTPFSRFSQITIRQRFVGDSVLGEMTTDGGVRRPIARRLSPTFGPYLSDALAPFALAGVPLSPGWRASVSIVGWAVVSSDVFFSATLEVIGEERLATPAGAVDCWKLRAIAGPERRIEWVRKSDGIALRSLDESANAKGRREFLLLDP
jgi:hypothetical protein